ncbi:MAG: hypothetical protein J7J36_02885 [Thermoplasmata archaeon]|nr:hypothetical protein [Thermoplasmata archaeon]
MKMKAEFKLKIECSSHKEAMAVNEALKVDNEEYIKSRMNGNYIIAEGKFDNLLSLLNTLNDFFSCMKVAIEAINLNE